MSKYKIVHQIELGRDYWYIYEWRKNPRTWYNWFPGGWWAYIHHTCQSEEAAEAKLLSHIRNYTVKELYYDSNGHREYYW